MKTEEEIRKVIADFERFKGGFAANEKNEVKQLNDELKNLDPSSEEYKDLQIRIRDLNKTIQDMLDIFKYDYDSLKNLTAEKETKQKSWQIQEIVHTVIMPNSKQRIINRKHKKRKIRIARQRAESLMEAKVGTLRKLDAIGQLPLTVKQKRLPNG